MMSQALQCARLCVRKDAGLLCMLDGYPTVRPEGYKGLLYHERLEQVTFSSGLMPRAKELA